MSDVVLSIVIPHFNIPEYLCKLLDSIPNISEIQVIVVDDKSTENLDALEKCKEKYSGRNIEFYDNDKEKGAGSSRNIGILHAVGKWITFADADDTFTPDFYEILGKYFDSDYDMVQFSPTSIDSKTGELSDRHKVICTFIDNYLNDPSYENMVRLRFGPRSPVSKLIRKKIIDDNNIRFENIPVANDVYFSTLINYYAKNLHVSAEIIYIITKRETSLTAVKDEGRFDTRVQAFVRKMRFLNEHVEKKDIELVPQKGIEFIVQAFRNKFGLKKVFSLIKLFRSEKIKIL